MKYCNVILVSPRNRLFPILISRSTVSLEGEDVGAVTSPTYDFKEGPNQGTETFGVPGFGGDRVTAEITILSEGTDLLFTIEQFDSNGNFLETLQVTAPPLPGAVDADLHEDVADVVVMPENDRISYLFKTARYRTVIE